VLKAMGTLGAKELPQTWLLVQPWGNASQPEALNRGQLDKASDEVIGILDAKRLARASLLTK